MAQSSTVRPKSNASSEQTLPQTWLRRNHISSFISILHLLDLDLREDWPNITVQTFSTKSSLQNLQQRIKAVEWSLYRLIELYDGQLARDKLRPFFPPQSPLQSQNLRAALVRVLSDLKNGGVFSRDTLLRKSTFDECKGDQFEKLLANVAQAVLCKCIPKSPERSPLGAAHPDSSNVLPLFISHQVLLSNNLRRRRESALTLQRQEQHAARTRAVLSEKRAWLKLRTNPAVDRREMIRTLVADSWTSDVSWKDVLLEGCPPDQVVTKGTWNASSGPQHQLQQQIHRQEIYVKRLKEIRESLLHISTPTPSTQAHQASKPTTLFRFDKHLSLYQTEEGDESQAHVGDNTIQRRCNDMLSRMEKELFEYTRQVSPQADKVQVSSDDQKQSPSPDQGNISSECSRLIDTPKGRGNDTPDPELEGPERLLSLPNISSKDPVRQASLLERTRMSLAGAKGHGKGFSGSAFPAWNQDSKTGENRKLHYDLRHDTIALNVADPQSSPVQFGRSSSPQTDSPSLPALPSLSPRANDSLAERTRKSMALLTTISDIKTNARKSTTAGISQLYPVNPFETPRKSSAQFSLDTPNSEMSTPRETLFSDDADVTSVFKSRPKIAVSPMSSPNRSVLTPGLDHLQLP